MSSLRVELLTSTQPYAAVKPGIPQRSDEDCRNAYLILRESGFINESMRYMMRETLWRAPDPRVVATQVEEMITADMRRQQPDITDDLLDRFLEMQALAVEGMIRFLQGKMPDPEPFQ